MGFARVMSTGAAVLAVGGCTVLAVSLGRAEVGHTVAGPGTTSPSGAVSSSIPALRRPDTGAVAGSSALPGMSRSTNTLGSHSPPATSVAVLSPAARTPGARRPNTGPGAPTGSARRAAVAHTSAAPPKPARTSRTPSTKPPARPTSTAAPQRGRSLPLPYSTGSASRVITVVATHTYSTTAQLQAWQKAPGGGWLRHGSAVTAHVGSAGLSSHPSEYTSATPIGSFTLTQAFGRYSDPGTALPYLTTTPADWWISQAGPLYNTHQRCSSNCRFSQGAPNEHLYYELPYYGYAVVIDYNRSPVRQGAGSAFFLHVSDGSATAGCVSIPQGTLVSIMRWLSPGAHPRILIGVS
jgi:L,D-peptidoglycan transpeptidase YkuD (ErfK/YbiS/YcfS/YnhG family)